MKQVDLQGNVYDIGIEANGFSDKALEQIVGVVRPILNEKDKEIERLNNIINDIDRYIHNWKLEDIGEKTMLILNDILLIKNGMSNEVIRLKGSDKE